MFFDSPGATGGTNSAVFVKTDATTQGTWKGVYGGEGYNVIDDTVAYPAYVTATPSNPLNYVWSASTTDARGLQKAAATDRIAATWYSSGSYNIDLSFSDTAQHQVAVYCLDWDYLGRTQTVSVLDGATQAVLDSRNLANFANGQYLVWKLSGHVILRITNTGPQNAVISGLFFDSPGATGGTNSAVFVKTDATTQGTWKGVYGGEGYNVIDDTVAYPAYVTATPSNPLNYVWSASTTDARGLQKAAATDRIAATWYSSGSYNIDLSFSDTAQHQVAVYCLDWDYLGRTQTVSVLDGATQAVLDSRNLANFANGQYLVWKLSGHVFRLTWRDGWDQFCGLREDGCDHPGDVERGVRGRRLQRHRRHGGVSGLRDRDPVQSVELRLERLHYRRAWAAEGRGDGPHRGHLV